MASTKSFFTLLAGLAARVKKAAENGYEDLKENLGDLGAKVDQKTAEAKASLKDLRETLRTKGAEIKEGTRDLLVKQLERLENALKQAEATAEESVGEQPDEQSTEA